MSLTYQERQVIRDFSLTVSGGSSVALMGKSGSGKSSVLSMVLGLLKPDSGEIRVGAIDVIRASQRSLTAMRRTRIGVVFQSGELVEDLTPVENVAVAGMLGGQSRDQATAEAVSWLSKLGVPTDVVRTSDLSGGEQQRVAVARALMGGPSLLIADEPTASLDSDTRDQIADAIFALPAQTGAALIIATHDRDVAARADRTVHLEEGDRS
ncbi:ABC transporter ATP-binding protein [Calidifontibacter indicus]|uniref:ABC transporter ATP-binding protein n=1 Tax=Calidifontibacter indicus TaxID=419650 RepID=UPI001B88291A|nr:ATP-binding cassette domain-containing protein [Calidifontibacter indicus]